MVPSRPPRRPVRARRQKAGLSRRGGRVAAFSSSAPPLQTAGQPGGRPPPEILAIQGPLRIQLPISQPTALGYHGTDGNGLPLQPVGRQANEGILSRMAHWLF